MDLMGERYINETIDTKDTSDTKDAPFRRWNVTLEIKTSEIKNGWFSRRTLENTEMHKITVYAMDKEHAETIAKGHFRVKRDRKPLVKIIFMEIISCELDPEPDRYLVTASASVSFGCESKDVTFKYFYPKNSSDVSLSNISLNAKSQYRLDVQELPKFQEIKSEVEVIISPDVEVYPEDNSDPQGED